MSDGGLDFTKLCAEAGLLPASDAELVQQSV